MTTKSISRKFTYALMAVISLLLIIFGSITIGITVANNERSLSNTLKRTVNMAKTILAAPLWNFDEQTLQDTAKEFILEPSISYVKIMSDKTVNALEFQDNYKDKQFEYFENSENFLTVAEPILYEDNEIGMIFLAVSKEFHKQILTANIIKIAEFFIVILIAIYVTLKIMTWKYIQKPLEKLQRSTTLIAEGNLETIIDTSSNDEIGNLAKGLNAMRESLKKLFSALKESSFQLISTSSEISKTANQQEISTKEFSTLAHNIASSSNEISATSKQLVKTMQDVSNIASNTTALADSGQNALKGMKNNMDQLLTETKTISSDLKTINNKTKNITTIITTLIKIADRTNLLSLNANIEAQKAGEHGLGFRIVAKEINRLAEQTAINTLHIKGFIQEMQDAIATGVNSMGSFTEKVLGTAEEVSSAGKQMTKIIGQVQTLTPRFNEVNEAMQFQTTGALEINKAMLQLRDMADQTMESLGEFKKSTEQLKDAGLKFRNTANK